MRRIVSDKKFDNRAYSLMKPKQRGSWSATARVINSVETAVDLGMEALTYFTLRHGLIRVLYAGACINKG